MTLEHVPPKTLGGLTRCLTCTNCNSNAGRHLDQAASMMDRAAKDQQAGRGMKVELDVFGTKHTTYFSPGGGANPKLAAKLASDPSGPLRNHKFLLVTEMTRGPVWDVSKGITMRVKQPPANRIAVSWLRSAYLLMFSFLGQAGYRYAESEAIRPIREQIMKPHEELVPCLLCNLPPSFSSHRNLIILNNQQQPFCWIVKVDSMAVLLPHGGTASHYIEVVDIPDQIHIREWRGWTPATFGKTFSIELGLREDSPHAGADLFGREFTVTEGDLERQCIIVNQQGLVSTIMPVGPLRRRTN